MTKGMFNEKTDKFVSPLLIGVGWTVLAIEMAQSGPVGQTGLIVFQTAAIWTIIRSMEREQELKNKLPEYYKIHSE